MGLQFSELWWLVNPLQRDWILFCYAWEVPVIGWTGAVLIPWLTLRRLQHRLDAGDPGAAAALARYPFQVGAMVLGTSTVGYLLGAVQIDWYAALPMLEFAKITIQGPAIGGLFGVAAYFMAERAVQDLPLAAAGPGRPGGCDGPRLAAPEDPLDHRRARDRRVGADLPVRPERRPAPAGGAAGARAP